MPTIQRQVYPEACRIFESRTKLVTVKLKGDNNYLSCGASLSLLGASDDAQRPGWMVEHPRVRFALVVLIIALIILGALACWDGAVREVRE